MSKRCTATNYARRQCERVADHLADDAALVHRYHAADDNCWIRHGAYDLSWNRCIAVANGYRCTNLATSGIGRSECGESKHRWADVEHDQNERDAQEADALDLCHSLGAP